MKKDWIEVELGQVANYLNGRAFKPSEWEDKGLPIIRIQNLNNPEGRFNYTQNEYEDRYLVNYGDLLFAWSASLGAYIWKGDKAWLNQHIFRVDQKPFISKSFLYYLLDWQTKQLYAKAHGSGMVHVTKKKFEETPVPLPPLPEQRAIVAKIEQLFSELDNGIANLKTALEQLKVYRQAVLKKAFEGELTKAWRAKQKDLPTAEELLDYIQKEKTSVFKGKKLEGPFFLGIDEFNSLPNGWAYVTLEHLKEFSIYGPRFSSKDYNEGGTAVLRTSDISDNGKVDWANAPKLPLSEDQYQKYKLVIGDLLITRTGSIGTISVFNDDKKAIPGAFLIHYRLHRASYIWYIFYFLKSHQAQTHFINHSMGVGRPNLNVPNIERLKIPLCSLAEQHQIVQEIESRLSVCDKVEETIKDSLDKAEALRQSILKKAFEGKLLTEQELAACRQQPDWEPAEKLLERIKKEGGKAARKSKKAQTAEVL